MLNSIETLLFTIYRLSSAIIHHWFNKRSLINRCSFNIPIMKALPLSVNFTCWHCLFVIC